MGQTNKVYSLSGDTLPGKHWLRVPAGSKVTAIPNANNTGRMTVVVTGPDGDVYWSDASITWFDDIQSERTSSFDKAKEWINEIKAAAKRLLSGGAMADMADKLDGGEK